ncbi:hypothetical protein HPT29_018075 [Microvirga terrae]|uniref:Transposase n=1 Tax=Microvirga terrae TaxID=2740529 RepID=A0ABY5RYN6_9HYPH|nr:hypothetical protein [Microvirga terrae]UVF22153.1 hypothetical protein HPT29_018075 [Microvirga terrae]
MSLGVQIRLWWAGLSLSVSAQLSRLQAIGRYIDGFYNPVRRHSTLDYASPAQFERLVE